jgi:ribosomal protein L37E
MIIPSFKMLENGKAILCKMCGMVSRNANDVKERYCGHCHIDHSMAARLAIAKLEKGMTVKARVGGMSSWVEGRLLVASPNGESLALECDEGLPLRASGVNRETGKLNVPLLFDHHLSAYTFLITGEPYELEVTTEPN